MSVLPELLISQQTGDEIDYEAAHEVAACHLFLSWLKDLDERLGLIYAKPGALSLEAGYWYIIRRNEGFPPSYWRVSDPEGRACVPDQSHIDMLQRIDAAKHPDVYRNYRRRQSEARAAGEKDAEELHREFREKLDERARHLYGTSIFVSPGMKEKL